MTDLTKLREDAERVVQGGGDWPDVVGQASAVLSLLDAQSAAEEALAAAGKALEPFDDYLVAAYANSDDPGEFLLVELADLRAARSALASVNAVLAGKNTDLADAAAAGAAMEEPGKRITLDELKAELGFPLSEAVPPKTEFEAAVGQYFRLLAASPTPPAGRKATPEGAWPDELTPGLQEVLGMMCFQLGPMCAPFRAIGHTIKHHAEEEQAFMLHWLVPFALKYGDQWRAHASKAMGDVVAEAQARAALAALRPSTGKEKAE